MVPSTAESKQERRTERVQPARCAQDAAESAETILIGDVSARFTAPEGRLS
jgi:hypothetical protein